MVFYSQVDKSAIESNYSLGKVVESLYRAEYRCAYMTERLLLISLHQLIRVFFAIHAYVKRGKVNSIFDFGERYSRNGKWSWADYTVNVERPT